MSGSVWGMSASVDLTRFVTAQEDGGTYASALRELRGGRKTGHWMWFVFPQVAGLGRSETARFYALSGVEEARAYLAHPTLGPRLLECADTLAGLNTHDPVSVLGSIDAMKLRSSMTLFAQAAETDEERVRFRAVLERFYGGAEDPETLRRL
jgi:uncharacterized protein (DUF1810 family)